MRLLRLDFDDELHRLDVHPLVTVIDGLSPEQRQQLFAGVRELARGSARTFRGLVEHRGSLVEVTRPADLVVDQQRRCAFDVVLHLDDADENGDLVGLQAEIDQCRQRAEIDAVVLEEYRADLNPSLWTDVIKLRSMIAQATTTAVSQPGVSSAPAEPAGRTGRATSRDATVEADRRRLETATAALADVDGCRRHLERYRSDVDDLLSRWWSFVELRERHGEHLSRLEYRLDQARARVAAAGAGLNQAEEDARPVLLSTEEEARLEKLAERAEAAGGGWRRRTGLDDDERRELDGLMTKVGVASWTEYSMFRLAPNVSPQRQQAIDAARLELTDAEHDLREAEVAVGSDPVAMELEAEYSRLRAEAMTHLGAVVPNDIGAGLRELADRVDNPEWIEAVVRLDRTLHRAGVTNELLAGDNPDQLVEWARRWVDYERSRLTTETGASAGTEAATEEPVPTSPAGTERDEEGPAVVEAAGGGHGPDIEMMRRALDDAEAKLVRHRRALAGIRRAQTRVAASTQRLGQLNRLAEQIRGPHGVTAREVMESIAPVIAQIRSDLGYPVPIVLSGSMPHLSSTEMRRFLDRVEELSAQVQLIVLAGRPEAVAWARSCGPRRALHSLGSAPSLWSTLP